MQKGSGAIYLLLGLLIVILITSGAYFLVKNTEQTKGPASNSPQNEAQTDLVKSADTFQNILTKYCKKIDLGPGAYFNGLQPDNLPVSIDYSEVKVKLREQETIPCALEPNSQGYVFVELEDSTKGIINIYDKYSKELGHGGPPILGSFDNVVKSEGVIKFSFALSGGEGPPIIGAVPVIIRGEKQLKLTGGEIIYINYTKIAIAGKDKRLVDLLNKYSKPSEFEPASQELASLPIEEVKSLFFSDFYNLQSPEKEAVTEITRILNAVSAK